MWLLSAIAKNAPTPRRGSSLKAGILTYCHIIPNSLSAVRNVFMRGGGGFPSQKKAHMWRVCWMLVVKGVLKLFCLFNVWLVRIGDWCDRWWCEQGYGRATWKVVSEGRFHTQVSTTLPPSRCCVGGRAGAINRSSTVTQMLQNRWCTDKQTDSHTFPIILPVRMKFTVTQRWVFSRKSVCIFSKMTGQWKSTQSS